MVNVMAELTAQQLVLNAALIVVTMFALTWRESRWARRAAASREWLHPRSVPRSAPARTRGAPDGQRAVSARRRAS